ncbi:ABC transporter permease [Spirosoma soli]|uniref:Transport permease protein n=1 Tax=Spirosoma soli TaxID=1770529 RepID=A0ABW5M8M0_9BACT
MSSKLKSTEWDWEITNKASSWELNVLEIWSYRNLMARLVRRDFLLSYQQTLLGPLWTLLQPIVTVFIYVLVFGKLVGISTGTVPPFLFYLSGTILWSFFNDVFTGTSSTFTANADLFGKVYFPRLIVPLSIISAQFLRLLIQLGLLAVALLYFWLLKDVPLRINVWLWFFPVILFITAAISLATGLIFSVITAKYRDLANVSSLLVRMFMFVTPIIYPVATVSEKNRWLINCNPLTPVFEAFRYGLLGEGDFTVLQLAYSCMSAVLLLLVGVLLFNRQKETLMDFL